MSYYDKIDDLFSDVEGLDFYDLVEKSKETRFRQHERKKILVDIKGGKCERCGYDKVFFALDFHHKGKKNFNISRAIHAFTNQQFEKLLIPEVKDKTILLCATCHREEISKKYRQVE